MSDAHIPADDLIARTRRVETPSALRSFAICLGLASACAVPPHAGNPSLSVSPVRREHWSAPALRIHVLSVNGAHVPKAALDRSVATLARHVGLPAELYDDGEIQLPMGTDGVLPIVLPWPVRDGEHVWTLEDLPAIPEQRLLLQESHGGIAGVVVKTNYEGQPVLYPLVEPGLILVAAVPGSAGGSGVTGYTTGVANTPDAGMNLGLVVLRASAIAKHANVFVDVNKLWEWTLTHEAGHVLGVPGSNSHTWVVPGLGPHCTHPECVMYTGIDWRVVVSGLLHGWPLDFCACCAGEMAEARAAAQEAREHADDPALRPR